MACGCKKSGVQLYTWTSTDGKQTVTNLNPVQAETRKNRLGGNLKPQ